MKKQISLLVLLLSVAVISGCAVFGGGCKCPKVSYSTIPKQ